VPDEDAFGRLVIRHHRELVAHCYRMLGWPQDAEDTLQETLLAAWRGLPGYEGRSSLRTWGCTGCWGGLLAAGLVDELYVMQYPMLLGAGLAAFPAGTARGLRLPDTRTRPTRRTSSCTTSSRTGEASRVPCAAECARLRA